MTGPRILLLATYGMEIVECGGALAKNVHAGGESHAAVLVREASQASPAPSHTGGTGSSTSTG